MPRVARKKSHTKVYHVILRGNDRKDIFFDDQDYAKFINEIINTKEKYKYEIYAYCLMTNHVHIVIYDKDDKISKIMQSLEIAYSSYFSKKYEKVGHLFQNRFLSKEVETREYLMSVCRYIHQNPVKAKISNIHYKWSSYKEYINMEKIINCKMLLSLFGNIKQEAIRNFIIYNNVNTEKTSDYIEFEIVTKLTDEQAKNVIEEILGKEIVNKINEYSTEKRNENIRKLKIIEGISKSQISRILGINRKIVERVMK